MTARYYTGVQGPVTSPPMESDADPTKRDQRPTGSQLTVADETSEEGAGTQLTQVSSHQHPGVQRRSFRHVAGLALFALAFGAGGWLLAKSSGSGTPAAGSPTSMTMTATEPPARSPVAPQTGTIEPEPQEEEAPRSATPLPTPSQSPATTGMRRPSPPPSPPSKRPSPCNPPYVVDENHIRHIKPQCL